MRTAFPSTMESTKKLPETNIAASLNWATKGAVGAVNN